MRQVACRCRAGGVAGAGSHQLILTSHSLHFLSQEDVFTRHLLFSVTSILALLYVFITIYCSIHRTLDVFISYTKHFINSVARYDSCLAFA